MLMKGVGKTVVYIDVLFGVNFIVNYILLRCTGLLCKSSPPRIRSVLGALLGALYAICVFFPSMSVLSSLSFKLISAAAIIAAAFPIYGMGEFAKLFFSFCAASLILGGAGFAVLFAAGLGKNVSAVISNTVFYMDIPFWALLAFAALFYCATGVFSFLSEVKSRCGARKKIIIEACGRRVEIVALSDTGNILTDPISRTKVLVAELDALSGLFDSRLRENLSSEDFQDGLFAMASVGLKARLIPFNSVGRDCGVMIGFVPDSAAVREGRCFKPMQCVVGVYPKSLSADKSYAALYNPN